MRLIVNPHEIEVEKTPVNEKEINITKIDFEFAEEITEEFVKEAYFTLNGNTYKKIIVNDECEIPYEVLTEKGQIEIGVVAYLVESEEEIKRYNPRSIFVQTWSGSLKSNAQNSEEITPSEMEQYEQALQDGLSEVNDKLDEIDSALTEVDNLDIDANKAGTTTTITITSKDGTTKEVQVLDGAKGDKGDTGEQGPQGVQGIQGERGLQGEKGDKGDKGDTGERGPQGIQGEKGETGNTGATGPKGDKGDKGDTGETGQAGRDGYVQYTAGDNITIENNVISATGGSDLPIYHFHSTIASNSEWTTTGVPVNLPSTDYETMASIIEDAYSKNYTNFLVYLTTNASWRSPILFTYGAYMEQIASKPTAIELYTLNGPLNNRIDSKNPKIISFQLTVNMSWSGNVPTVSAIKVIGVQATCLTSTSDVAYTPSGNYNPATKKYVDDAIAAIQPSGGSNYPFYVANLGVEEQGTGFQNGYTFSSSDKQTMAGIINDAYNKGFKAIDFILTKDDNTARPITFSNSVDNEYWGSSIQTQPTEITWYATWLSNRFDTYNVPMLGSSQITLQLSWSNNVVTVTNGWYYTEEIMIATITNTVNYSVSDSFIPAHKQYVDDTVNKNVITSSSGTYTIDSLVGNTSYKLGEITALTITATTTFDRESVIYFTSGTTATTVSLPSSITNLGDAPTMTLASNVNTGTCTASKNYIIAIENNIAVWKEY